MMHRLVSGTGKVMAGALVASGLALSMSGTSLAKRPIKPPHIAQPSTGLSADEICAQHMVLDRPDPRIRRSNYAQAVTVAAPPPPPPPPPPSMASPPPPTPVTKAGPQAERAVRGNAVSMPRHYPPVAHPGPDRERYDGEEVSGILRVAEAPVSTFSVDVDTGSYTNMRRMVGQGRLPQSAAVRTEEMLNYFRYDYPQPKSAKAPFSIATDIAKTPWNDQSRILRVGLSGYQLPIAERPAANLVFLVDVSGSMRSMNKLPLVKCSLALAAENLRPQDRVSIVTYAGGTKLVLKPTNDKQRVIDAIAHLQAGGSTAGAAAIQLAYDTARKNYRKDQVNRIMLATDGDFNVGLTNRDALVDMVERERENGISLTALGYGTGNYNEAMMEQIANHGNGNYFYIDRPLEAQKVLGEELAGTLFTIAKDVKIQIEFNPAHVSEYRLIGYENRALEEEDFNNDTVDAGEIGAGHQVTALYELVPAGNRGWTPERRYIANAREQASGDRSSEMAQIRLRYKMPNGDTSKLIERIIPARTLAKAGKPSSDMRFAMAVAGYAQYLRGDKYLKGWTIGDSIDLAKGATNAPWRSDFITVARKAEELRKGG